MKKISRIILFFVFFNIQVTVKADISTYKNPSRSEYTLTWVEYLNLSTNAKVRYIDTIRKTLVKLEDAQNKFFGKDSYGLYKLLYIKAYADDFKGIAEGVECVYGGNFSKYGPEFNGKNYCIRPKAKHCGKVNIPCNPSIFGSDNGGAAHCVKAGPYATMNCYKKMNDEDIEAFVKNLKYSDFLEINKIENYCNKPVKRQKLICDRFLKKRIMELRKNGLCSKFSSVFSKEVLEADAGPNCDAQCKSKDYSSFFKTMCGAQFEIKKKEEASSENGSGNSNSEMVEPKTDEKDDSETSPLKVSKDTNVKGFTFVNENSINDRKGIEFSISADDGTKKGRLTVESGKGSNLTDDLSAGYGDRSINCSTPNFEACISDLKSGNYFKTEARKRKMTNYKESKELTPFNILSKERIPVNGYIQNYNYQNNGKILYGSNFIYFWKDSYQRFNVESELDGSSFDFISDFVSEIAPLGTKENSNAPLGRPDVDVNNGPFTKGI